MSPMRGDIMIDIKNILDKNFSLSNEFGKYSKIYMMTTENIKGFLETCYLENKNVLTVAGSGDQMLNAYLMGAKNVTCFDINPLAFYQVELKKAAVSTLSYQEFLDFFFLEFNNILSPKIFEKIAPALGFEACTFFQLLYNNYNSNDIFKRVYYNFSPSLDKMKRMNAYLEEDNYTKLSSILKNKDISFIESDITTLPEKLNDHSYDYILLSNISDSIQDIWQNNSLKNFKRLIHTLSKHLNLYGMIQVGYIYDYYSNAKKQIFQNKNLRQSVFTTDEFHSTFVESYRFHSESDGIITYQKTKKKR